MPQPITPKLSQGGNVIDTVELPLAKQIAEEPRTHDLPTDPTPHPPQGSKSCVKLDKNAENMWVSKGVLPNGWFCMVLWWKIPFKWMIWEYPYFRKQQYGRKIMKTHMKEFAASLPNCRTKGSRRQCLSKALAISKGDLWSSWGLIPPWNGGVAMDCLFVDSFEMLWGSVTREWVDHENWR